MLHPTTKDQSVWQFDHDFVSRALIVELSDVFTLMGLQGKFAVKNRGPRPGLVLLVAAAEGTEGLTPQLRRCFTHEVTVEAPDEEQRLLLLHHFLGLKKEQACIKSEKDLEEKEGKV